MPFFGPINGISFHTLFFVSIKVPPQLELPARDTTISLTLTSETAKAGHSPLFGRAVLRVLTASICTPWERPVLFMSSLRPTSIQLPIWQGSCTERNGEKLLQPPDAMCQVFELKMEYHHHSMVLLYSCNSELKWIISKWEKRDGLLQSPTVEARTFCNVPGFYMTKVNVRLWNCADSRLQKWDGPLLHKELGRKLVE